LALLNADAFPEPDWLASLLEAAARFPNACFASRQIQANTPDLLDGEGDVYHVSGLAWRRNYGLPVHTRGEIEEIFSPCAAAALYPRQAFLDAGGFDEDYFAYHEDVDLGFRLRLNGLRCFYVPQAIVYHVGSASTGKMSDFVIYHGHRNLAWTYVKNFPAILFWLFLPLHFAMSLYYLISFSIKGHGKAIWPAKLDAARGLGRMLQKRKYIQQNRQVSAATIYQVMERSLIAPLHVMIQRRWFENQKNGHRYTTEKE
jgi:GT2 family glycosyltransferase